MNKIKLTFKLLFMVLFVVVVVIAVANTIINKSSSKYIYENTDKLPTNKTGLLLGTIKQLKNGKQNRYYTYRIQAAVQLFNEKKVKYILISGDNSRKNYDEPTQMKNDLMDKGIPEKNIYLDYAGFRTFDSVVRAKEVFGQDSFTIISQKFHNQRAIYIAHKKGISAIAFNARNVNKYASLKTTIREYFARVKVFIDLAVNKQPKFLGKKIEIR